MDLREAIVGRRSIRRYNDKQISQADIEEIMELGTYAPSGTDLQPWFFVVCQSEESLKKLVEVVDGCIFSLSKRLNERFKNYPEVVDATLDFVKSLGGSKCCVLAFMLRDDYEDKLSVTESISAAIQNMLLTAHSKGIGSCWLTAPMTVKDELKETFAPEKGEFVGMVTLGYSDKEPRTPKRKEDRVIYI